MTKFHELPNSPRTCISMLLMLSLQRSNKICEKSPRLVGPTKYRECLKSYPTWKQNALILIIESLENPLECVRMHKIAWHLTRFLKFPRGRSLTPQWSWSWVTQRSAGWLATLGLKGSQLECIAIRLWNLHGTDYRGQSVGVYRD